MDGLKVMPRVVSSKAYEAEQLTYSNALLRSQAPREARPEGRSGVHPGDEVNCGNIDLQQAKDLGVTFSDQLRVLSQASACAAELPARLTAVVELGYKGGIKVSWRRP